MDTPADRRDCGVSPENVSHFSFHCPIYDLSRIDLQHTVSNLLRPIHPLGNTELYLYAHYSLTPQPKTKQLSYLQSNI